MQIIGFPLAPGSENIEIHRPLKATSLCDSGGAGKAMVANGLVRVGNDVETPKTAKIRKGLIVTCAQVRVVVRQADEQN